MANLNHRIAIIGAGISGLSTALCLHRVGFKRVTLYDMASTAESMHHTNSTGCVIAANGMRILDRLGVAKHVHTSGTPVHSIVQTKPSGARLSSYAPSDILQEYMNSRIGTKPQMLTHVACWGHTLTNVLLDELMQRSGRSNVIQYGHQLTDITKLERTNHHTGDTKLILQLHFNDEISPSREQQRHVQIDNQQVDPSHEYDILIGCDGFNSYVRLNELEHGRRLAVRDVNGAVYVSGVATLSVNEANDEYWRNNRSLLVECWGNGVRLIHTFISRQHVYWHISLNSKYSHVANNKHTAINSLLTHVLQNWPSSIRTLVDKTDSSTVHTGNLHDRMPSSRFASDQYNIALVGSAIHPVLPDTYQNVAQCLESSVALALCLANDTPERALEQYAQLRYPRVSHIMNTAYGECSTAVEYSAFMSAIRDWATGLMPEQISSETLKGVLQYDIMRKFTDKTLG